MYILYCVAPLFMLGITEFCSTFIYNIVDTFIILETSLIAYSNTF